ncbi:hypothetical protein [Neorhizobium sp. JUb45]|uniref:hypothetical protein n=1 Tax=unclassified Neorhizobium TaxID=2629175 RepID=UPI00104BA021|nr:hypothetical protein [Neorhizobium sp. JUb45]TCQ99991.1 hypothetical protein EDF70_10769 [Neorhizobium sp. JUb45]
MKIRSKRDLAVFNELSKHHAAWCNQLATAVGAAGAIVPFMAAVLSFQLTLTIFVSALFWLPSQSCYIHLVHFY